MIKKLLFTILMILNVSFVFAQFDNISIIGQFTDWSVDVPMNTSDGIIYTVTSQNFSVSGGAKFRKDNDWAVNWGAATFPTGVGVQNGADIPVPMGTYDVVFNKETGDYTFTQVESVFDNIGMIGGFNEWTESVALTTFDGVLYTKEDYQFTANEVKFRKDNSWEVNWGGTTFPSGEAVTGGSNIPLTSGFYNVAFNYSGLNYTFIQVPVTLLGDGAQGWDTDIPLLSNDGGVTFTLENVTLLDGFVKFRTNSSWSTNWGSADFPTGTGTQGGSNIPTVAGTYTVTFNRLTGEYNFATLSVGDFASSKAKVYPNPTQNVWNFSVENEIIENIQLVDVTGKVIITEVSSNDIVSIDATLLSSGIYFAKVKTNTAVQTIKLVRN